MMEDLQFERTTVLEGEFEDVIEIKDHYYLISKKHRVTVLPYTIDSKGLLDKVGVVKDYNYIDEEYDYTLVNGYITADDGTNLVAANRVLYEAIGLNMTQADDWMYLGGLYNTLTSDSAIDLYCVDLTDKPVQETEEATENKQRIRFKMIDSSQVITSDDTLLLASYLRLFNYFYVNSLDKKTGDEYVKPQSLQQDSVKLKNTPEDELDQQLTHINI